MNSPGVAAQLEILGENLDIPVREITITRDRGDIEDGGEGVKEKVSWEFLGLRAVSCRWPYGGRVYWPAAKRSRVS